MEIVWIGDTLDWVLMAIAVAMVVAAGIVFWWGSK